MIIFQKAKTNYEIIVFLIVGISGRPNIAAIICPVVFGVFVIVTVLYFIKKVKQL